MKRDIQGRKVWIDYARVFAILCVVLCHATESYYGAVIRGTHHVGSLAWMVENSLFTLGRLGVPVFLAITGALLLGRDIKPTEFYKKSLVPLILTTEIWIIINYLFVCVVDGMDFVLKDLIWEMLFLKTLELSHMWYMPVIIGIYIALPFVSAAVKAYSNIKSYYFPYILGVFIFVGIPTVNVFLTEAVPEINSLKCIFDMKFLGGIYGFYVISGYFISDRRVLEKVKTVSLIMIWAAAFIVNSAGQYYLYLNAYFKSSKLLWYTSFPIFVMGLIGFELIRRWFEKGTTVDSAVRIIAGCSFGIYLLHKPVLVILYKYILAGRVNVMAGIIILFAAGFGISMIVLFLFYRFGRKIGRVFFFIK